MGLFKKKTKEEILDTLTREINTMASEIENHILKQNKLIKSKSKKGGFDEAKFEDRETMKIYRRYIRRFRGIIKRILSNSLKSNDFDKRTRQNFKGLIVGFGILGENFNFLK